MQPRGPLSHASSNARLHESSPVVVQKDPPASKIGFSKTLWFQAYLEKKENVLKIQFEIVYQLKIS